MHSTTPPGHEPRAHLRAGWACALIAAAALACPSAASAQDIGEPRGVAPANPANEPANLRIHTVIFAAGTATLATVGALQSHLAPSSCRWCDRHADGTDGLNGFDRAVRKALVWRHPNTASTISDVLAFGLLPAVAFGADAWSARAAGRAGEFKVDALVIGESMILAGNVAELLKFATARQRPYAHARAFGEPANVAPASSDNLSFTSGHVAAAFAITVSAARVMTLRRSGRPALVWGIGLPVAAAVGYFRIAADRHYLTDILASAGIGTVTGLIVPHLIFKERSAGSGASSRVALAPFASGPLVGVTFAW